MSKEKTTTIEQALKDLKTSGCPTYLIDNIFNEFKANPKLLKDSNDLFKNHQYPDKSLDWIKYFRNIEIEKFLSPYAFMIFMGLTKNMRISNLIQASNIDISKIVNISNTNKRTISKYIKELLNCGCIAIAIQGTPRRGVIYMINPEIAIIGTGNQKQLTKIFWQLTGSSYNQNKQERISTIQENWIKLTAHRTYSIGYGKQKTNENTLYFATINEPKVKKNKSSAGTNDLKDIDDLSMSI